MDVPRVALPTIFVRLRLLLHARRGSDLVRTGRKSCEKPASDRSIVLVLSGDRQMARESHMIEAYVEEAQQQ